MQKIEAYEASDGTLLRSESDCQEYETSLIWRGRIAEFMASELNPYYGPAQASIAQKVIIAWENFKVLHPGASGRPVIGREA